MPVWILSQCSWCFTIGAPIFGKKSIQSKYKVIIYQEGNGLMVFKILFESKPHPLFLFGVSENGWMIGETFYECFFEFVSHIAATDKIFKIDIIFITC